MWTLHPPGWTAENCLEFLFPFAVNDFFLSQHVHLIKTDDFVSDRVNDLFFGNSYSTGAGIGSFFLITAVRVENTTTIEEI